MATNIDDFLRMRAAALNLLSQRSEVLASNLANADTPNYKAKDIDFKSILGQMQQGGDVGGTLALETTDANQIGGAASASNPDLLYRIPTQPSIDGNTVDAQTEKAAFMDNALHYEATLRFIDGSIKTLRSAIQGN